MKLWIDPPNGWKYGFPKILDTEKDKSVREFLIKWGYPAKDIPFALQHLRQWPVVPVEHD